MIDLRHFDLALLPALDALLRERNVTRAAARLFVTQQAMSGTLRRLRAYFDDDLLLRVGRSYELSPFGRELLTPVREALLAVQTALDTRPLFDAATAAGRLDVAMSDYASTVLMPAVLRELSRVAPGIALTVSPVRGDGLRRVADGRLDLCLVADDLALFPGERPDEELRSARLFEDDFVVVFDGDVLQFEGPLDGSAYRALRHGQTVFEEGVASIVERGWAEDGGRFDVAVTAPSFAMLVLMLPGTPIIATVQRRLAWELAPKLGLTVAECPLPLARLGETMTWHRRHDASPSHAFVRAIFAEAANTL